MLLDDINARIQVVAKLHKTLLTTELRKGVNLGAFLQQIADMVSKLNPDGMLVVTFDNSCDVYIDPRQALQTGLISAELLTNAKKYAHPSGSPVKVHIRCETEDDGSFVVEVTDDGIGFSDKFDPDKDGGAGFQIMRALANGLNATLQFEHRGRGVRARLVKPSGLASLATSSRGALSGTERSSYAASRFADINGRGGDAI
jgi:two-component sensor histidine kinase